MNYSIEFAGTARKDFKFWKSSGKQTILKRIQKLLIDTKKNPFEGIGKPEPLKHKLSGYWSRRITDEHRMIYKVEKSSIYVIALRHHYSRK